jgi:hypothetical protein
VVGVEDPGVFVGAFLADAVEVADGAAAVGAASPLVAGPELEVGGLGGLLHRVERGEEGGGVDAVAGAVVGLGDGHVVGPLIGSASRDG